MAAAGSSCTSSATVGEVATLVRRAEAAGYEAICLTVDLPVLGYRDEVIRRTLRSGRGRVRQPAQARSVAPTADMDDNLDMRGVGLTWDVLDEIRSWSSLPLVLKGILTGEDAELAVEHGADGVWVSNHGGRQLDRTAASIEVLDEVVRAVDGRAEVYLDGGVRRGPEVLIALALGATAVFTARPFLYALACAGEAGVAKAFEILRDEIERSMALLGTPRIRDIGRAPRRARRAARVTTSSSSAAASSAWRPRCGSSSAGRSCRSGCWTRSRRWPGTRPVTTVACSMRACTTRRGRSRRACAVPARPRWRRMPPRHDIPVEHVGKLVVALGEDELPRMRTLLERGLANEVEGLEEVGPERMREIEPHVAGVGAPVVAADRDHRLRHRERADGR